MDDMENVMHFKIALIAESYEDPKKLITTETRRFEFENSALNYMTLREKLINIFPNLHNTPFNITWIDKEHDEITISNDEELKIFLKEKGLNKAHVIHKLYVKIKKNYDFTQNNQSSGARVNGILHSNVVCDGCEKAVQGFRYKCLICPDYDLCSDCEHQGLHPEHYMLRTAYPGNWHGRCMPRLSKRFVRHMKKAAARMKEEEKESRNAYREEEQPSWVENLVQLLSDWANIPSEQSSKDEACGKVGREQRNSKQTPLCDNVLHKMQNILDHSLHFLDPLGVDVAMNMNDHRTKEKDDRNGEASGSKVANDVNVNQASSTHVNEETTRELNKSAEKHCTEQLVQENEKPEKKSLLDTSKRQNEIEGWTLLNANDNSSSSPSDSAIEKPSAPMDVSYGATLYPNLQENSETFYNPRIEHAVRTMTEMGFSNEGGWLTQLLISKQGDISKALDVLEPKR